jgi:acetoin utilization deacetylase AcuC-like enzyme
MTTGLISHNACLGHQPPPGHPESPDRLRAVLRGLETAEFQDLVREEAPEASREALLRIHSPAHVDAVLGRFADEAARDRYFRIDADTAMSNGSAQAALRAAGAVVLAVDRVMAGEYRNAFCAVRPPGHHATRTRAMGFCLFNNVAAGALHARKAHGIERIAVIDFDVHHGNGTQGIFFGDANLFYASTHQSPLYPGTGQSSEHGIASNIVNVPLAEGAGSDEFRAAFETIIIPALENFSPQFVFISAGFDAHARDPLAGLQLSDSDFFWATQKLCRIAAEACQNRVVSTLEGGYDLGALATSAAAHVRALMET